MLARSAEQCKVCSILAVPLVLGLLWNWRRCRKCSSCNGDSKGTHSWQSNCEVLTNRKQQIIDTREDISKVHFSELLLGLLSPQVLCHLQWHDIMHLHRAGRSYTHLLSPVDVLRQLASLGLIQTARVTSNLNVLLKEKQKLSVAQVRDAVLEEALLAGGDLAVVLNAANSRGQTPLLLAVQHRHPEALTTLLRMGARPDIGDKTSGWSPLMFAISAQDERAAKMLVSHGASVNHIARPHGYTPFMAALAMNNESLVEWLVDCGADPSYTLSTLHANLSHYGKEYELLRRVLASRKRV